MLYHVYFDDSETSTLSGYFEEPGSLEEAQACVAVLEQVLRCLEAGIFKSATVYRDCVLIQKFESNMADIERIRALPRADVDALIAGMSKSAGKK